MSHQLTLIKLEAWLLKKIMSCQKNYIKCNKSMLCTFQNVFIKKYYKIWCLWTCTLKGFVPRLGIEKYMLHDLNQNRLLLLRLPYFLISFDTLDSRLAYFTQGIIKFQIYQYWLSDASAQFTLSLLKGIKVKPIAPISLR